MGCDIHLRLEKKLKKEKVWNKFYTEKCVWKNCSIFNANYEWRDRIYGMFAVLADVRNHWDFEHLPLRGFPKDACLCTVKCYAIPVVDEYKYEWEKKSCILRKDAEKQVHDGYSEMINVDGDDFCSVGDYHSPNWCTTQEMEDCINKVFKDKNGNWTGEPYEWLALLGAMKGYEWTGEYEVRAVFWFDN